MPAGLPLGKTEPNGNLVVRKMLEPRQPEYLVMQGRKRCHRPVQTAQLGILDLRESVAQTRLVSSLEP
jgi:hypothetical protein